MSADFSSGIAFVDGAFCALEDAKLSLFDLGFLRSDATQDTVSVWRGQFFRLDAHLDRFERNYTHLHMACPLDRAAQHEAVMACVRRTGFKDAYVQMLMTRGRLPAGSRDIRRCENRYFIFCLPYVWISSPEQQEGGLHLSVSPIQRIPPESVDPRVKNYHWLDFEMSLFDAYDRGADTTILLNREGDLTEGPGFNIFLLKDGRLLTPDDGVLDGMTRTTVFELCAETNLQCAAAKLSRDSLDDADEVFLCSTAGGIMPVSWIDGKAVGEGAPGPVTLGLRQRYWRKREAGWHGTPVDYEVADGEGGG